jgi:hypothetical protein
MVKVRVKLDRKGAVWGWLLRLVEQSRYAAVFKISVLSVWVKSEGSGRGWRVPTCPDV